MSEKPATGPWRTDEPIRNKPILAFFVGEGFEVVVYGSNCHEPIKPVKWAEILEYNGDADGDKLEAAAEAVRRMLTGMSDCKICNGIGKTKYVYEDGGYSEIECPCVRRRLEAENERLKAENSVMLEFWLAEMEYAKHEPCDDLSMCIIDAIREYKK